MSHNSCHLVYHGFFNAFVVAVVDVISTRRKFLTLVVVVVVVVLVFLRLDKFGKIVCDLNVKNKFGF